jgi:CheY-like chemotaxis protein
MSRILAIEADPRRKRVLAGIVREYVDAELKIADTAKAAIALIRDEIPDVILAPALLSPRDGAELMAHVRQRTDAPYVQLLTIPALDLLADAPEDERRGLFAPLFIKHATRAPARYDRAIVGAQIADGVARAREGRREHEEALALREELARSLAERRELARIRPFDGPVARHAGVDHLVVESMPSYAQGGDDRRTSLRLPLSELPWLSGIKVAWGTEVALVNMSTSGVLMETGSKFLPGSTTELHLNGPGTEMVVPVRFIRSDVARIDRFGVKYHAAAAFEREIDLSGPRGSSSRSQAQALADLLASVLDPRDRRAEPAHARFVRGVRDLIGARNVQLIALAPGSITSRDPLSFEIPGDDPSRRALHATFERPHTVTDEQRTLLRAAALLVAATLELETPARQPNRNAEVKLLEECVA